VCPPPLVARDRALIALFAGQGLRTIEVHRVNLADLDLEAAELVVRRKRSDRWVHLRADVVALVRAWLVLRPDAPPDQPLFVGFGSTCRGLRLSRRGIRSVLARTFAAAGLVPAALSEPRRDGSRRPLRRAALGLAARRAAGVHVPSAHGLRATYITLSRAGGAELEAIADDVGHADIRMTRRYLDRSRRKANNSALRIRSTLAHEARNRSAPLFHLKEVAASVMADPNDLHLVLTLDAIKNGSFEFWVGNGGFG
jgi:integrase